MSQLVNLEGVRYDTVGEVAPTLQPVEKNTGIANDLSDLWLGEGIESMIDAVPDPERYYITITQVMIKRKVGSILIPETAVSDQDYTHGLGIVVKVGKAVYKGRKFEDIGLDESDGFKPGDLVIFRAGASPHRIWVDGRLFLSITDDSVTSRPKREHLHRIKFTI